MTNTDTREGLRERFDKYCNSGFEKDALGATNFENLKSFITLEIATARAEERERVLLDGMDAIGKEYDAVVGTDRDDDANGLAWAVAIIKALRTTPSPEEQTQ